MLSFFLAWVPPTVPVSGGLMMIVEKTRQGFIPSIEALLDLTI
jgi:hypothetical protein